MLKAVRRMLTFWIVAAGFAIGSDCNEAVAQKKAGAPKKMAANPPPSNSSTAKVDPDETKDKPAIESELIPPGSYRGQLLGTPNQGGLFRVAVDYRRVRVRPGKEAEYDKIQKD